MRQAWRHWKACEIPYNSREGIESKFRRHHGQNPKNFQRPTTWPCGISTRRVVFRKTVQFSILGITPYSEARLTQGRWRWKATSISYNIGEDIKPKIVAENPQYSFDEQGGRLEFSD
ncbi:hypothetical protein LINGRAHAP2_LOCUS2772 [Linum grandiflorum]